MTYPSRTCRYLWSPVIIFFSRMGHSTLKLRETRAAEHGAGCSGNFSESDISVAGTFTGVRARL